MPTEAPLLEVRDLTVAFRAGEHALAAVRGVSFALGAGESLGVLGESGSGKSVTALALMDLLDPKRTSLGGEICINGVDLLALRGAERGTFRGRTLAMIFQDALSALNPVQCVGRQIAEVLRVHHGASRPVARAGAVELMEHVGIPAARERYASYPHELSGGMRQRIMIAIALAARPALLIADEPTTSLDVTVQAQIMELLARLREETGMALVFITHDIGLSMEVVERIAVMYAGRIVEMGPAADIYRAPAHPYTAGLVASMPSRAAKGATLVPISGAPPSLQRIPSGCPFHPRCPRAEAICAEVEPALEPVGAGRQAACHFAGGARP